MIVLALYTQIFSNFEIINNLHALLLETVLKFLSISFVLIYILFLIFIN